VRSCVRRGRHVCGYAGVGGGGRQKRGRGCSGPLVSCLLGAEGVTTLEDEEADVTMFMATLVKVPGPFVDGRRFVAVRSSFGIVVARFIAKDTRCVLAALAAASSRSWASSSSSSANEMPRGVFWATVDRASSSASSSIGSGPIAARSVTGRGSRATGGEGGGDGEGARDSPGSVWLRDEPTCEGQKSCTDGETAGEPGASTEDVSGAGERGDHSGGGNGGS
jgi:hypothetical protein